MAFINTQAVLSAAETAALAEANHVLPELIEGSEPTVLATISAVFDIIQAGIDAGLSKVPFVGGLLTKVLNGFLLNIEKSIDSYVSTTAKQLASAKVNPKAPQGASTGGLNARS